MLKSETLVMIPVYNEEKGVRRTIDSIPNNVNKIIIIDDGSTDDTIKEIEKTNRIVVLLRKHKNEGKGNALITGIIWLQDYLKTNNIDIETSVLVFMDGDGQMDPNFMYKLVEPIKQGEAKFVKATRFRGIYLSSKMPKFRKFGNYVLRYLNRLGSGHWNVTDPQNGYFALSLDTILKLNIKKFDFGFFIENSILFETRKFNIPLTEVSVPAIYGVGEISHINYVSYIPETSMKLFLNWINRIYSTKYQSSFRFLSFLSLIFFLIPWLTALLLFPTFKLSFLTKMISISSFALAILFDYLDFFVLMKKQTKP